MGPPTTSGSNRTPFLWSRISAPLLDTSERRRGGARPRTRPDRLLAPVDCGSRGRRRLSPSRDSRVDPHATAGTGRDPSRARPRDRFRQHGLLLEPGTGNADGGPGSLGLLLVLLLVLENVFLLSNPRFVLPFLPTLYFLAVMSATPLRLGNFRTGLVAGTSFVLFVGLVATHRFVLDWEWGRIERAGVTIRQRIPVHSLPRKEPATLHVRIAAPLVPSAAHFEILGP